MKRSIVQFLLFCTLGWLVFAGCRKETTFITAGTQLHFSADTVFLDTVFTSIGSSTRLLKVFNKTNDNIIITEVKLGRGSTSYFRLNVNGESSKTVANVELPANDSLYVFVEVTADVLGANELLYTDSIVFNTGGKQQDVKLVTLAKDAHFYYPTNTLVIPQPAPNPDIKIPYSVLPPNAQWSTDKPHVIYGYVVVDSAQSLDILAGTEVHFHSNSGLWVYSGGQLQIDGANAGSMDNPVLIQGDRLEPSYENIPGQWGGILGGIFIQTGAQNNIINNAIIKNGSIAIRVDSTGNSQPNLVLNNVQVLNHSRVGIYAGFANIAAQNVVVANCGLHNFYALGGSYDFKHSTFANYWTTSSRNTAGVSFTNFFEDNAGNRYIRPINNAYFGNCIIYGNAFTEVGLGIEPSGTFNYLFRNNLLRIDENPTSNHYDINDPTYFLNCIFNQSPRFENYGVNNYALDSLSPALDFGNLNDASFVPLDIFGNSRSVSPDLGAIERQ